jgi:3-oxoacyl-[acyl-carrier protein] reductase
MDLGLSGKVAMVAGASRGLGYAVAQALAVEGAAVSIASRDADAIAKAADGLRRETGARIVAVPADVRDAGAIDRWYQKTVGELERVDLLFANSGGPRPGRFVELDDQAWQAAYELLVLSTVRLIRSVLPSMTERGGSILVATSSAVKEPIPNLTLSNALRASVAALAKTLAVELAPRRIRVNQLVPGRIDTVRVRELDEANAQKSGIPADEQRRRSVAAIPLGRYGEPVEFGRAAAFLLSDAAGYITGATLQVDGGLIRAVM